MTQGDAHRLARALRSRRESALAGTCGVHLVRPCGQPPVGIVKDSDPPLAVCAAGKHEVERQGYNVIGAAEVRVWGS